MSNTSLIERARLFVRLLICDKQSVKQVKHGTTRHQSISQDLLPSKKKMLEYCKTKGIDWRAHNFQAPNQTDNIVLAIFVDSFGSETFKECIQHRPQLLAEYQELTTEKSQVVIPVLDAGSYLSIILAACYELELPVYECDLLNAARDNSIQFLTAYKLTSKSFHRKLQPMNIPQKNKTLRDQTQELRAALRLSTKINYDQVSIRIQNDLGLEALFDLSHKILQRCNKVISSVFDVAACYIIAIKIKYGESAQIASEIELRLPKHNGLEWTQS